MRERLSGLEKGLWKESFLLKNSLQNKGYDIAVAESCTGGEVAATLTRVPGISSIFKGGIVVYSPYYKSHIAGVSEDIVDIYGTVSPEVALSLAKEIRDISQVSVGVSVVCVLGPALDEKGHPVGTTYIGISTSDTSIVKKFMVRRLPRPIMKRVVALKVIRAVREVIER